MGAGATKSNALTPAGMGPTVVRGGIERGMRSCKANIAESQGARVFACATEVPNVSMCSLRATRKLTHARVELLVVLLALRGADVDQAPFEVCLSARVRKNKGGGLGRGLATGGWPLAERHDRATFLPSYPRRARPAPRRATRPTSHPCPAKFPPVRRNVLPRAPRAEACRCDPCSLDAHPQQAAQWPQI